MARGQTPSQTVGPFYSLALTPREDSYAWPAIAGPSTVSPDTAGERIRVTGRVRDGAGEPVADALIELWQANARGRYRHPADRHEVLSLDPAFHGFARTGTGTAADHAFTLHTVKPGPTGDGQAPHLNLLLFMRGGLSHLYTRVYFDDEARANAADPVWSSVPAARRGTLLARRAETADGLVYHFDIHMQGSRETVFFDL